MSTIARITSPYKVYTDFTKVDLPRSSEAYIQVAAIEEFSIFLSAAIKFNNKSVMVKCEVDDEIVFELDLEDLKDMLSQGEDSSMNGMPFTFDDQSDTFTFKPSAGLMCRSSIKFFAKAATTSSSRDFNAAVVEYTKE